MMNSCRMGWGGAAGWAAVMGVGCILDTGRVVGAEAGQFVVPGIRLGVTGGGGVGTLFGYWDLFVADDEGYNFGMPNLPGLLGGEDEVGNPSTLTVGAALFQTGTDSAFVTSSGAIYSFSESTAFRVEYTASHEETVTNVIFQTLTGGRRFDLEDIWLEYLSEGEGEPRTVRRAPEFKALDDPQTGAFAERLVSAFQWDLSGRGVRGFQLVFSAPGSSMPLWEAQLDVVMGSPFQQQLGRLLRGEARPLLQFQVAGRIDTNMPSGAETRFHLPAAVLRLTGVPTMGFAHAGWHSDGAIQETSELEVVFGNDDVPVTAIFAPLSYSTWRTYWFQHANAVLGTPADHLNDALSGMAADPDGDGAENFAEFAFGGDPYVADASVRELPSGVADAAPLLAYRQPASAQVGVTYQLFASETLVDWVPVDMVVVSRELDTTGYWRVTVREATTGDTAARPSLRLQASLKP